MPVSLTEKIHHSHKTYSISIRVMQLHPYENNDYFVGNAEFTSFFFTRNSKRNSTNINGAADMETGKKGFPPTSKNGLSNLNLSLN